MDIDELLHQRDEKEKELKSLSDKLKIANEDLEIRVEERTKELMIAKEVAEDRCQENLGGYLIHVNTCRHNS